MLGILHLTGKENALLFVLHCVCSRWVLWILVSYLHCLWCGVMYAICTISDTVKEEKFEGSKFRDFAWTDLFMGWNFRGFISPVYIFVTRHLWIFKNPLLHAGVCIFPRPIKCIQTVPSSLYTTSSPLTIWRPKLLLFKVVVRTWSSWRSEPQLKLCLFQLIHAVFSDTAMHYVALSV